jgi:hypothetical protein
MAVIAATYRASRSVLRSRSGKLAAVVQAWPVLLLS